MSYLAEKGKEELIQDFISIATRFYARQCGQRGSKHKPERVIADLSQSPAASVSSLGGQV